jgi:hypothetical protein
VRKLLPPQHRDPVSISAPNGGGVELAHAVGSEDGSRLEWGGEEGAGLVRLVMLGICKLARRRKTKGP